eukprot:Tbor_TRINITY_DN3478_c0_g1::TRINITY_DN3478_c0_g1_i1::g.3757::m.3757
MQRGKLKAKRATEAVSVASSGSSNIPLQNSTTESTNQCGTIPVTTSIKASSYSTIVSTSDDDTPINKCHLKKPTPVNYESRTAMIPNPPLTPESAHSDFKDENNQEYTILTTTDNDRICSASLRIEDDDETNTVRQWKYGQDSTLITTSREIMISVKEEMKRRKECNVINREREESMPCTVGQNGSPVSSITSATSFTPFISGTAPSPSSPNRPYLTRLEYKLYQASVWNTDPIVDSTLTPLSLPKPYPPSVQSAISLSTKGGSRRTNCRKITFAAPCGVDSSDSISATSMCTSSSNSVKKGPPERTLFVARLPITVTDKDLKDFGNQFGRVESVSVTRKRRTVLTVTDKVDSSGNHTQEFTKESDKIVNCGYGFIVFAKAAEVKKALLAFTAFKESSSSSHELSARRRAFMIHNKEILIDEMRGVPTEGSFNIPTVPPSQLPPVPLTFTDSLIYSDEDIDKSEYDESSNKRVGDQMTIIEPFVFASTANLRDTYKREAFSGLRATQQERRAEQQAHMEVIAQKRRALAVGGAGLIDNVNDTVSSASLLGDTDQWRVRKILKRIQEQNKRKEEDEDGSGGEMVHRSGKQKRSSMLYLGHGVDPFVEYYHPISLALTPGNKRQVIKSSYPQMPATLEGTPRFCEFFPPAKYVLGNQNNGSDINANHFPFVLAFLDLIRLSAHGGAGTSEFLPVSYCSSNDINGETATATYQSFDTAVRRYQSFLRRRVRRRRRDVCMAPFIPLRFRANRVLAMMCSVRRQYWTRVLRGATEENTLNNINVAVANSTGSFQTLTGHTRGSDDTKAMESDHNAAAGIEAFLAEFAGEGIDDGVLLPEYINESDDDY